MSTKCTQTTNKRPSKIEVILSPDKQGRRRWYFRVVASNGKILCHSEQYNRSASAIKGLRSMYSAIHYGTADLFIEGVQEDPKHLVN